MALYSLAEDCDYKEWKEEVIHDRLVVGIRDPALSKQMQMDSGFTLEKAKKTFRQKEAVREQSEFLGGSKATSKDIDQVQGSSTAIKDESSTGRLKQQGKSKCG